MYRIYGFVNGYTGAIIYVGQTVQRLAARLAQARHEWKRGLDGKRKHLAISGVYAMGGRLRIIQLDHAATQAEADSREIWWIDILRERGYAWGNTSAGGPGNVGVRRGMRQRKQIASSLRAYHKKRNLYLNHIITSSVISRLKVNKEPLA